MEEWRWEAMAEVKPAKHPGGRPRLFQSVQELEAKIKAYFNECDEKGRPYTISGLAYHLDIDRRTLLNYAKTDEFFPTISRARERCEGYAEEQLFIGNDRGAKFSLMNNYGWRDKQEAEITVNGDVALVIKRARERVNRAKGSGDKPR
jgi:hypothetical protein